MHPLRGGELDRERRRQRGIVRGRSTGTQTARKIVMFSRQVGS
jgi:hypothetical protein